MPFDYYTPPSQAIFDEIKNAAIAIWKTYDDTYGYASGKIERIKGMKNVKDNAWFIIAMFDPHNQARLVGLVSDETATLIKAAIFDQHQL
jgi:hypothetical protein